MARQCQAGDYNVIRYIWCWEPKRFSDSLMVSCWAGLRYDNRQGISNNKHLKSAQREQTGKSFGNTCRILEIASVLPLPAPSPSDIRPSRRIRLTIPMSCTGSPVVRIRFRITLLMCPIMCHSDPEKCQLFWQRCPSVLAPIVEIGDQSGHS